MHIKDHASLWVDMHAQVNSKTKLIYVRLEDTQTSKEHQEKLQGAADLLDAIVNLQEHYISGNDATKLFQEIISTVRKFTKSDYAFFGVLGRNKKKMRIVFLNHKEIIKNINQLNFSYDNFDLLYTNTIANKDVVISNTPENDPRYAGNPPYLENEKMKSFMGLPLIISKGIVGMIGIANGKQNYRPEHARQLDLFLKIVASIIEAQSTANILEQLAHYDHITGLYNRASFEEQLKEDVKSSKPAKKHFALFYLDLDNFKNINDTLGHKVGDEVLALVAKRLRNAVRETDFIARLGGYEFAIIVYELHDSSNLKSIAEKIKHQLSTPFKVSEKEIKVQTSMGISMFPDSGETADKLLSHADFALYRAKKQVFTRYCFYSKKLHKQHYRRIEIEDNLDAALNEDQFYMLYQPQLNLKDNSIRGFEALIRWQHPELGKISPGEFIKVAEETGRIEQLNLWVIKQTLKDYHKIVKLTDKHYQLSINISPRISNLKLHFQEIEEVLESHQNILNYIDIEITETALAHTLDEFEKIIHALHQRLNLKITIDDFGVAFSSMNRLRNLHVKAIKIDMSFIQSICDDHKTAMIVKSIIDLGENLEVDVIAEGVETDVQIDKLKEFNCPVVQGFYYFQPLDFDTLCETLPGS